MIHLGVKIETKDGKRAIQARVSLLTYKPPQGRRKARRGAKNVAGVEAKILRPKKKGEEKKPRG